MVFTLFRVLLSLFCLSLGLYLGGVCLVSAIHAPTSGFLSSLFVAGIWLFYAGGFSLPVTGGLLVLYGVGKLGMRLLHKLT
jgi:hypothetical protein